MLQAHLALYSFANGQISASLKLMYRALYLALLCSGDSHPDIALYYVSIMLMLLACRCLLATVTVSEILFCDDQHSYSTPGSVSAWVGDHLKMGKPTRHRI